MRIRSMPGSSITRQLVVVGLALAASGMPAAASAADQTILGNRLVMKDPSGGVVATKRRVSASGRERTSPNTLLGDPTAPGSGATLAIYLNGGTTPSVYTLPQGVAPGGKPYWTGAAAKGFRYVDAKGVQGPVKKLQLGRSASGTFIVAAQLTGAHGTVPAPPDPGTSGCVAVALGLDATAERYSVQFGADGQITAVPGKLFAVKKPAIEGVCPPAPCGVTAYPTCGGVCDAGEVCRPLSGHGGTPDSSGHCGCVVENGPTDCPAGQAFLTGGLEHDVPLGCAPIPTCNDVQTSGYPECAGGAAAGTSCQPVRAFDPVFVVDASLCVPVPSDQPCPGTCSGVTQVGICPSGQVCASSSAGVEGMDCGCVTPPFCGDGAACSGSCPDSACLTCPPGICGSSPVCFCSGD